MKRFEFGRCANIASRLLEGYVKAVALQAATNESIREMFELLGQLAQEIQSLQQIADEIINNRGTLKVDEALALMAMRDMATEAEDFSGGLQRGQFTEVARRKLTYAIWKFRIAANIAPTDAA